VNDNQTPELPLGRLQFGHSVRVDRTPPDDWQGTLSELVDRVRATTGLVLDTSVRWVSPEEERARDEDFRRRWSEPGVKVLLGSASGDDASPLASDYEGHWVLVLPGQETLVHDSSDFGGLIEDYVIEEVWRQTGVAPMPDFLRGR
jgi:hypothetical protein